MNPSKSSTNFEVSCAPLTIDVPWPLSNFVCAPSSQPKNLTRYSGGLSSDLAMSTALTTLVLMPLPRPSICWFRVGWEWSGLKKEG